MSVLASQGTPHDSAPAPAGPRAWLQPGGRFDVRKLSPNRLKDSGLDLRNTWQIVAGAVLLPLGVAVILLGWSGAAHGRVEQQQIPYLISGGLLGLGCIIVGCFFFWAHWLYRIYDQADLHHQESMRQQAELITVLQQLAGTPARTTRGRQAAAGASEAQFVATPTGSNVHSPDCPIVAGRASTLRQLSRTEARGMKPCRVCEPALD